MNNMTQQQLQKLQVWIVEVTGLKPFQVENCIQLFSEGSTVPFIARYRKERTGELDEVIIREIDELFRYFCDLEQRRQTVLKSIEEQGKLTPELRERIEATRQKQELEDLYLPYKPKRRTKAAIAREKGLQPLADMIILQQITSGSPEVVAASFVAPEKGVADAQAALEGAAHILAECLADDADARAMVRRMTSDDGVWVSKAVADKREQQSKYEMYYDFQESLKTIPSHRMLAMRRGEKDGVLYLTLAAPAEQIVAGLKARLIKVASIFSELLGQVAADAYKRLIAPSIEVELRLESKERADHDAIAVFAGNLRNLLMAPPAGGRRTLGIDPGLRTGSKLAVVDATGRFLEHVTIYPHTGETQLPKARREFIRLVTQHDIEMIAVGNGTAGREMESFAKETLSIEGLSIAVVMVSEAGASVYSASEIAREEFPDQDLTVRGAISIARRLQDPLGELVKIDPKSIGVGQYQHDVNQSMLQRSLDAVVESCVNQVGVDLNTASWALLSYVSGIGQSLAKTIVKYRDENGPFASRTALMQVPRFGVRAFEQSAGFLRIKGGGNPLDNTSVHPERYGLVERMAADSGITLEQLTSDAAAVELIRPERYVTDEVGLPTLNDIIAELKKPGRDPREAFTLAAFREDVRELKDLQPGMILQGVVTNVTAFGAFVDIGVHQDGLVHISHLSKRYVKEPSSVVHAGQLVNVRVLACDIQRKRISLSIKEAS